MLIFDLSQSGMKRFHGKNWGIFYNRDGILKFLYGDLLDLEFKQKKNKKIHFPNWGKKYSKEQKSHNNRGYFENQPSQTIRFFPFQESKTNYWGGDFYHRFALRFWFQQSGRIS